MILGYGFAATSDGVAPSVMVVLSAADIAAIMTGQILTKVADEETAQITVWYAPTHEIGLRLLRESGTLSPDADIREG